MLQGTLTPLGREKSRLHYPNAKAGIHVPAFLRREKTRPGRPPARVHLVFYTKKGPPEGLTRRDVLSAIDQLAPSTRHPTTTMRRHTPRSMCTPLKRHIIAKDSCSLKAPRNKNAKEKKKDRDERETPEASWYQLAASSLPFSRLFPHPTPTGPQPACACLYVHPCLRLFVPARPRCPLSQANRSSIDTLQAQLYLFCRVFGNEAAPSPPCPTSPPRGQPRPHCTQRAIRGAAA